MDQKYILLISDSDVNKGLFDPNARDNCTEPFILLREECQKLGYQVEAADRQSLKDVAWLLFWDASSVIRWRGVKGFLRRVRYGFPARAKNWLDAAQREGVANRMALFLWEAPAVCPENWDPEFYSQFSTVFSWNDNIVDGVRIHKFHLPIPVNVPVVEKIGFFSKKLLINISMNKFSTYPHELYSARREAIRYFENARPNDFDLYGVGWDDPGVGIRSKWALLGADRKSTPYKTYRGTVRHKWDVLPKYRFALCYENVSDQPGWITEKIFDCMRAGCVPIYLGAPNITDYVDPAAFVDRQKFKSNQELENYLSGISEPQYEQFLEAIAIYLESDRFKAFLSPAFCKTVLKVLGIDQPN
jgi:hypothetical protein